MVALDEIGFGNFVFVSFLNRRIGFCSLKLSKGVKYRTDRLLSVTKMDGMEIPCLRASSFCEFLLNMSMRV